MEKKEFIKPEITLIVIEHDEIICSSNTYDPDGMMSKGYINMY